MLSTPDLTARMERFREVLHVNLRHSHSDYRGAKRDFYLHFHEVRIDTGLCSEASLSGPCARDHYYRPEAFWKVFMNRPSLIDDGLFPDIYTELCKTIRISKAENNYLRGRFKHTLTERLYEVAGMRLMERDGNKIWRFSKSLESPSIPVPEFMRDLEIEFLNRN